MMLSIPALLLLIANLGLLWLLMAAPLGTRTIRMRRILPAPPERIWSMVHPLGREAAWSPAILSSEALAEPGRVEQRFAHSDRRGQPIRRTLAVETSESEAASVYDARVIEDSALDPAAWANYRERRIVSAAAGGTELLVEQTDRYRGVALLAYRFFMLRRELVQLQSCVTTGEARSSKMFEHPVTQAGLAALSTLLLWPFFGLDRAGLTLSTLLTVVIVLHELGHMAAYRTFGHGKVRMMFIPLLGGIAIGSRPYASRFEVAVCALMGAGFSALLVPAAIAVHMWMAGKATLHGMDGALLVFLLVLSAFNLLNLLPMSRFDGGQVLHQVFPTRDGVMGASFLVTAAILWAGHRIGIPLEALLGGLAVMALMSMTNLTSFKPREALDDMSAGERLHAGLAYYAVLALHAGGLVYATDQLYSPLS